MKFEPIDRSQLIHFGGKISRLSLDPRDELFHGSFRNLLLDLRPGFSDWDSAARSDDSLQIKFDDRSMTKLDQLLDGGAGDGPLILVQTDDKVAVPADVFSDWYVPPLEEQRAAGDSPIPGGAWFLPTPLTLPLGDEDPSPLFGDENPLVPDDPIPEVTEDLLLIESPPPPDPVVVPDEEEPPPEPIISAAIINAVFGDASQPLD
jgi:hypothetical protein